MIPAVAVAQALWTGNLCAATPNEFLDKDISELMGITIIPVSKEQAVSDAASAIYVINREGIQRSGVTSIPEALSMASGIQVSRIASNKWAISLRGLGGQSFNKLLVQVDGRTVYTPGFSSTYWDTQNLRLEDVERIEIIRGPGATMWGANTVNGAINVITKNSSDTLGGLITVGTGNAEEVISGFRYGAKFNSATTGRVYLSYNQRAPFDLLGDGSDANDHWDAFIGGFRLDGEVAGDNTWTLQGDLYNNQENQTVEPLFMPTAPFATHDLSELNAQGTNIMGNWEKRFVTSALKLQAYFDYVNRDEVYVGQTYKTTDLDIQYDQELGSRHNLSLGAGYRNINAVIGETYAATNILDDNCDLFSAFFQDTVELVNDRFWFTLGTKWEYNSFTGYEFQPSGRLLWKPTDTQSLWAGISRAVRTPLIAEQQDTAIIRQNSALQPFFSPFVTVNGNADFESEEVYAYETGYRWFAKPELSFDLALFYNDYEDFLSTQQSSTSASPGDSDFINSVKGSSYGFELAADWAARSWLKFAFTYSYLYLDFTDISQSLSQAALYNGNAPEHQVSLRTSFDFAENWQANVWLRYTNELEVTSLTPNATKPEVDEYLECDLNLRWQATDDLELMLVGQNLFDSKKPEYSSGQFNPPIEAERSYYLKALYHF